MNTNTEETYESSPYGLAVDKFDQAIKKMEEQGLSRRVAKNLADYGILNADEAVNAINSGQLKPYYCGHEGLLPFNYGTSAHMNVLRWLTSLRKKGGVRPVNTGELSEAKAMALFKIKSRKAFWAMVRKKKIDFTTRRVVERSFRFIDLAPHIDGR